MKTSLIFRDTTFKNLLLVWRRIRKNNFTRTPNRQLRLIGRIKHIVNIPRYWSDHGYQAVRENWRTDTEMGSDSPDVIMHPYVSS